MSIMLVKKYFGYVSAVEFNAEWKRLDDNGRAELIHMVEAEVSAGRFQVS